MRTLAHLTELEGDRSEQAREGLLCRYPQGQILGDYALAAVGALLTLGPASLLPLGSTGFVILSVLGLLFVAFAAHTRRRQTSLLRVDGEGISLEPAGASFSWAELDALELSYFSTRSDRTKGWMQLKLRASGGSRLKIDSHLEGFQTIVAHAGRAALARGLELNRATRANLESLGVAGPDAGAAGP